MTKLRQLYASVAKDATTAVGQLSNRHLMSEAETAKLSSIK